MNVSDKNLSIDGLYKKLELLVNTKFDELKKEIQPYKDSHEHKYREAEVRHLNIERRIRRNNIIIFGLQCINQEDIVSHVIQFMNEKLSLNLIENDINNISKIGTKNVILVEFVSYLKKRTVFNNINNLKGTNVSIANDLCPEDRKNRKILYQHLKEAKRSNKNAYIRKDKLIINGEEFSVDKLKEFAENESEGLLQENNTYIYNSDQQAQSPGIEPVSYCQESKKSKEQGQRGLQNNIALEGSPRGKDKKYNTNEGRALRAKYKK